jgi:two-component system sensor histidine kinase/response regulator
MSRPTPAPAIEAPLRAHPSREDLLAQIAALEAYTRKLEAAREGDARYRALAELSPDAILVSAGGRYAYANAAAARLLGAAHPDQIVGATPFEFMDPEHHEVIRERHRRVIEQRRTAPPIEYRWHRLDGGTVDVEVTAGPIAWKGATAVLVIARDITSRRQAEAELRMSEERFRLTLRHSAIIVAACDRELRYTWICNPHPAFDAREIIGKRDDELAPRESLADLIRMKEEVLASGRGVHRTISVTVGTEVKHYDITAEPLRDETGAVVGVTTAAADITSLRELERAASAASHAKSRFLSTMSHELRTPLTAIIGLSGLLEGEIVGPVTSAQKAHIARIKASAWHLVSLVDEILTLSRVEAGREEARLGDGDLAAVTREVVDILANVAHAKGLALIVHGASEPVAAHTDAGKVRQIALNLIGNAIKYTETGRIDVELRSDEREIILQVRDTGVGIPPERLEDIFDPFVQVEGSQRMEGSTGLGLAICRRLARLLGGDVSVASELGRGSAFTLRFPRSLSSDGEPRDEDRV